MHTGPTLRPSWVLALVAILVMFGSGGFAVAQRVQPLPTEEDDGPPVISTIPAGLPPLQIPTPTPTRPPRVTPTPTVQPVARPRVTPTSTVAVESTAILPQPQPNLPGDSLPGDQPPRGVEPWLPGQHNRFEITLHTCPEGIDPAGDEAAFLAACPLTVQDPPPDNIYFQMRDGDQTHVVPDIEGDSVYVFDDITIIPGPRFFIVEEFNPGYGDPAVFCGEGGAPHQRVPAEYRVIRPQLSTFANVEYSCTWFKIPLQGDTVRVHDLLCPRDPGPAEGFLWHWQNCQPADAGSASTFTLTDATGAQAALTVDGAASWANVDFGAAGTVEIERLVATGTLPYRVYCGDFNSGTLMTVTDGAVTVEQAPDAPPVEYTCRWFRYLADSDFDDAIQAPSTLDAEVYLCPPGQDRSAGRDTLVLACTGPNPGLDIALAYPGGMLAIVTTSGANPATAFFGLIGEGDAAATAEVPAGYAAPVVYCQLDTGQGWTSVGNGVNGSVALPFTWNQAAQCAWFHFPEP